VYPSIKEVIARDDYTLSLVFENGENGVLDMKPILDFGVFRRIKDWEKFRRVRIAFDTIEWTAGSISIRNIYMQNARRGRRSKPIDFSV
jgi:hypothetical protein